MSGSLQPPWSSACQASLSITYSWSLLKLMSIELVMPSNHLILCHPLLLSPLIFPSIRVFTIESVLHIRWPKYWSFSFSISPSNEYSRMISFRIDWFDFLAVQKTLKSLLQHYSFCTRKTKTLCRQDELASMMSPMRCIREGNGNPLQYSCPGNPMDRRACGLQSMGL